ncbi:MAG: ATP-binding cassette domain-containing protein [Proteobacteria bacterium]|nr:ATP-binding cassette domain-containing protein [Pseudomonadota bacterium]
MEAERVIDVSNLTTHYGTRLVHEGISFHVNQGEIFVILGGSGSGKSTLLRHLSGLLIPTAGRIIIDGMEITGSDTIDPEKTIFSTGVMFQSGALFNSLSLLENVALPIRKFTKIDKQTIWEISRIKLGMVGLSGFESYYPHQISGGMKKRVGVARAMALDPKILFLDEPSAGLDPISADDLDDLILELNHKLGITFVVVTHELASIYKIADRAIMLGWGRISAEGHPQELKHSEKNWVSDFFNRKGKHSRTVQKSSVAKKDVPKGWMP